MQLQTIKSCCVQEISYKTRSPRARLLRDLNTILSFSLLITSFPVSKFNQLILILVISRQNANAFALLFGQDLTHFDEVLICNKNQ